MRPSENRPSILTCQGGLDGAREGSKHAQKGEKGKDMKNETTASTHDELIGLHRQNGKALAEQTYRNDASEQKLFAKIAENIQTEEDLKAVHTFAKNAVYVKAGVDIKGGYASIVTLAKKGDKQHLRCYNALAKKVQRLRDGLFPSDEPTETAEKKAKAKKPTTIDEALKVLEEATELSLNDLARLKKLISKAQG